MMKAHYSLAKAFSMAFVAVALSTANSLFASEPTEAQKAVLKEKATQNLSRYPIGFWNYMNLAIPEQAEHQLEADVQQWADAGFTVPISPFFNPEVPEHREHIRKMLDWADARDMKMIVWDNRVNSGDDAKAAEGIKEFADHPANYAFFVWDEPDKGPHDRILKATKCIQENAPKQVGFINLFPMFDWLKPIVGAETGWDNYLDRMVKEYNLRVICYDCYTQSFGNKEGEECYFDNLRIHREASLRNGVPFWTTLLSVPHFNYKVSTQGDVEWQFNTAVCSGASGILWFYYYNYEPSDGYRDALVDQLWETTPLYTSLRKVHHTFASYYGALFNELCTDRVTFFPAARGNFEPFSPNERIQSVEVIATSGEDKKCMIGEFVDAAGNDYVMVVNDSPKDSTQFKVIFPESRSVETFVWKSAGKKTVGVPTTQLFWLAPGAAKVFKLPRK